MNFSFHETFHESTFRGHITRPLLYLPQQPQALIPQNWFFFTLNDYIDIDVGVTALFQKLYNKIQVLNARATEEQTDQISPILQQIETVVKKMEFYRFENRLNELFYHQNGLLSLFEFGSLKSIYLISKIQKHKLKEKDQIISLKNLKKEETQGIFTDIALRISRIVLRELKSQMYCPSTELCNKVLSNFGLSYNTSLTLEENYKNALIHKKINKDTSHHRDCLAILFTLKIVKEFSSLQGICYYLNFLKNMLLDRNSNILSDDYEGWVQIYETSLKIYARYEQARKGEYIEVDQILSNPASDAEFHNFLMKYGLNETVSLASINFYLKNSKKQERQQLKPMILQKIDILMKENIWKYLEDILEYVQEQTTNELKIKMIEKLMTYCKIIITEDFSGKNIYQVEFGLTFLLQSVVKYVNAHHLIINEGNLSEIYQKLNTTTSKQNIVLLFRLFNDFFSHIYHQINQFDQKITDCQNSMQLIFKIISKFSELNCICSKSVFKLLLGYATSLNISKQESQIFWKEVTELYLTQTYEHNADLQVIHSNETHKQFIAENLIKIFAILGQQQVIERRQLQKCLKTAKQDDYHLAYSQSFIMAKSFKDELLFETIKTICVNFNPNLAVQETLLFAMNYYTPFVGMKNWKHQDQEMCLLSILSEQFPIQILKLIYKEIYEKMEMNYNAIQELSPIFWLSLWKADRKQFAKGLFSEKISMQAIEFLQNLKRFEFIMNAMTCVFDKLNDQSQVSIKQIRVIYQKGADKIIQILGHLKGPLIDAVAVDLSAKSKDLMSDELKNLQITEEDDNPSIYKKCFLMNNHFMEAVEMFNNIGKINESNKLLLVEMKIYDCFQKINYEGENTNNKIIGRQLEICIFLETNWRTVIYNVQKKQLVVSIIKDKRWAKDSLQVLRQFFQDLKEFKKNEKVALQNQLIIKINNHIKLIAGKVFLPEMLRMLLTTEIKESQSKYYYQVMRVILEIIYLMDQEYEEHFVYLLQKFDEIVKHKGNQKQNEQAQAKVILSYLQLFFDLILNKIRIRSYHLYRLIKFYLKVTNEELCNFNSIIAHHVRILFEEFITNYKTLPEMNKLCASKKNIETKYSKLNKTSHTLSLIECSCTLSMFINLFCRLNYQNLAFGIEKLFSEDESKIIYVDYLISLSKQLNKENSQICAKDLDIMKIDVFGNLSIITKGTLSSRLLNRVVSLAKNLLRLKVDLNGINRLPVKLLVEKISTESIDINLDQFQEEEKALSLGVISIFKKLSKNIQSNIHICNIYYFAGKNFEKVIEINKGLISSLHSKQQIHTQVENLKKIQLNNVKISINNAAFAVINSLIRKIQNYYPLSLKDETYLGKFYTVFKILCISCMNNPEIIPYVIKQKIKINNKDMTFLNFIGETLKHCLPLYCQFYLAMIKSNGGFVRLKNEVISLSLQIEIQMRLNLLRLLHQDTQKSEKEYRYLVEAISFTIKTSENYRFRSYRFVKTCNQSYQNFLRDFQLYYCTEVMKILSNHLSKSDLQTDFINQKYNLVETILERIISPRTLDFGRVKLDEQIKEFIGLSPLNEQNKENIQQPKIRQKRKSVERIQSMKQILNKMQFINQTCQMKQKQQKYEIYPRNRLLIIQQDIVSLSDSKEMIKEWNQIDSTSNSTINKAIIEKFMVFAEEIENKSFMRDLLIFPIDPKSIMKQNTANDHLNPTQSDGVQEESEDDIIEDQIDQHDQINESKEDMPHRSTNRPPSYDLINENGFIEEDSDAIREECQQIIEICPSSQKCSSQNTSLEEANKNLIIREPLESVPDGSIQLICNQDLHMIAEDIQEVRNPLPHQIETNKDDIVALIEDYTLNPEAIKLITLKIKYLNTQDLKKILISSEGEVKFALENQLKSRGVYVQKKKMNCFYQDFFIDQSRLYEHFKFGKRQTIDNTNLKLIPDFSEEGVKLFYFSYIQLFKNQENNLLKIKKYNNLLRKLLIKKQNSIKFINFGIYLLTLNENEYSMTYSEQTILNDEKSSEKNFKRIIIDNIFNHMIECRLALPIFFFGEWSHHTASLKQSEKNEKIRPILRSQKDQKVIEIIFRCLIMNSKKYSSFLQILSEYITSLQKMSKWTYPYYEIQDKLAFSEELVECLSNQMHSRMESLSNNQKFDQLINIASFLNLKTFEKFLSLEMKKIGDVIKKIYLREDGIIKFYKKNYYDQKIQIERKAEIYWQLRKAKNGDEFITQLAFCRSLLTDIGSTVIDKIKQNCFLMEFGEEDSKMRQKLSKMKRKVDEDKNFKEMAEYQKVLEQSEKQYDCWKKNLINQIIRDQLKQVIQIVSEPFLNEISETQNLYSQIYDCFSQLIESTPILYRQCSQFYKMLLAYELMTKDEDQTYHSMSLIKTKPSILSAKDAGRNSRRRSTLRESLKNNISIALGSSKTVTNMLKRSKQYFTFQTVFLDPNDPLFGIHAKYSNNDSKIKFLHKLNKGGQKIIQLSRDSMWKDTLPHLDDSFGEYDIKIKITGQIGIDYGGITREWITLLAKQMVDPKLGLFELNVNQLAFQPSKNSCLVPNHLFLFHKFGLLVGKAMKQNWLLEINFTKSFLKHILGFTLYVQDLQDIDPDTAKGLLWILQNEIDEDLGMYFAYEQDFLGEKKIIELIPGGSSILVTEQNKKDYVKKLAYAKMTEQIRSQSLAFMSGIEKVIPYNVLKLFSYKQIGRYLAGAPTVNISEMRNYARYEGFDEKSQTVQWFWQVLESETEQDKANFLFFLTGSYKVPYNGFKQNPITINKMACCKDFLPVAHTCFSIIDLPEYSSLQKLRRQLKIAFKEGKGFSVS